MVRLFAGRDIAPRFALLTLTLVAIMLRGWHVGDPLLGIDQQFYDLVGRRMHDGILPYRDVFDIKPVGIFAFHALAASFASASRLVADIMATGFAAATAVAIYAIVRNFAGGRAGVCAGLTYLAYLPVFDGYGAQTPVIYNLFTALAAWIMLRLATADPASSRWAMLACAPMLLMGIALQVKYTAVFEGVWMGLFLIWISHRGGVVLPRNAMRAVMWASCAMLPLAAAFAYYSTIGAQAAFIDANFLTVLNTGTATSPWSRLAVSIALLSPLLATIIPALKARRTRAATDGERLQITFMAGWVLTSLGSYLLFGTWLRHYALPLLLPLSVMAGVACGPWLTSVRGKVAISVIAALVLGIGTYRVIDERSEHGTRAQLRALTDVVALAVADRCLYVFDGPPVLYVTTHACMPTRFIFPQHLENMRFAAYPPVSQGAEITRIMATRPGAVVLGAKPLSQTNPAARATLQRALVTGGYRHTATLPVGEAFYSIWTLQPYRDSPTASSNLP